MGDPQENLKIAMRRHDGAEDVWAPGAMLWNNITEQERPAAAAGQEFYRRARAAIPDWHQESTYLPHEGGVVVRNLMTGTGVDGEAIRILSCVLLTIEDAKITRVEEYGDTGQLPPLRRALEAAAARE